MRRREAVGCEEEVTGEVVARERERGREVEDEAMQA